MNVWVDGCAHYQYVEMRYCKYVEFVHEGFGMCVRGSAGDQSDNALVCSDEWLNVCCVCCC